jgi:hypothetical protein
MVKEVVISLGIPMSLGAILKGLHLVLKEIMFLEVLFSLGEINLGK